MISLTVEQGRSLIGILKMHEAERLDFFGDMYTDEQVDAIQSLVTLVVDEEKR